MPRTRTLQRAASRDEQREAASTNPGHGPARAERRKNGWRGDISAQTNAHRPRRHPGHRADQSGQHRIPTSGQARINAKRTARARYWDKFTIYQLRLRRGLMGISEYRRHLGVAEPVAR